VIYVQLRSAKVSSKEAEQRGRKKEGEAPGAPRAETTPARRQELELESRSPRRDGLALASGRGYAANGPRHEFNNTLGHLSMAFVEGYAEQAQTRRTPRSINDCKASMGIQTLAKKDHFAGDMMEFGPGRSKYTGPSFDRKSRYACPKDPAKNDSTPGL